MTFSCWYYDMPAQLQAASLYTKKIFFIKIIYYKISRCIFNILIEDHEIIDLFVLLQVIKASTSLSWNLTVA